MALVDVFPALAAVSKGRDTLPTHEAAPAINRRPQTLRKWACLECGPIRPLRINGRLAWRVADLRALLQGGTVEKSSALLSPLDHVLFLAADATEVERLSRRDYMAINAAVKGTHELAPFRGWRVRTTPRANRLAHSMARVLSTIFRCDVQSLSASVDLDRDDLIAAPTTPMFAPPELIHPADDRAMRAFTSVTEVADTIHKSQSLSKDKARGRLRGAAAPCNTKPPCTHESEPNMKLDDLFPSKFLKQTDVDGEVVVTVTAIKKMNVAREGEALDFKPVIKFAEFEKPMVANATNSKRAFKALGENTDDWIGGKLILYVDENVEYEGKITGGLRLKPLPPVKKPTRRVAVTEPDGETFENDIPFE